MSKPTTRAVPELGGRSVVSIRMRVVLPALDAAQLTGWPVFPSTQFCL